MAEAASIAAKNGDKRMSLNSFNTSTHHVDCKSGKDTSEYCFAISFLFFVHCPLSVKSFIDLSMAPRKIRVRSHKSGESDFHHSVAVIVP